MIPSNTGPQRVATHTRPMHVGGWARPYWATADQVSAARRWIGVLLDGCPRRDDALLIASEQITNAVRHACQDTFLVAVTATPTSARIVVSDGGGGPDAPHVEVAPGEVSKDLDDLPHGGFGLGLVAALATDWGAWGGSAGHTVWARLTWIDPAGGQPSLTSQNEQSHSARADLLEDEHDDR